MAFSNRCSNMSFALRGLVPGWEMSLTEECLGGPFAQVDRKSYTVPIVAAENDYPFALWMAAKDRQHSFREEDWSTPTVRDPHSFKGRMQVSDPVFKPAQQFCGLATANIVAAQISGTFLG